MFVPKTNAIYGDANAQTATVVPDLAKASDNSALLVSQNTADLDINQKLQLSDLFYETTTEEVYPQITSAGNCAIIGSTMGWTRMDQMILEMEFTVTTTSNDTGAASVVNPAFDTVVQRGLWNTPAFAMLHGIQRFDISMGNNNQKIGRQQMTNTQGIILTAQDQKYDENKIATIAQVGLPRTRGAYAPIVQQQGFSRAFFQNQTTIQPSWIQFWQNTINDLIISAAKDTFFTNETGMDNKIRIGVPLSMLNSFFKNSAFFPPGTPYRMEIQHLTSVFTIATSNAASAILSPNSTIQLTHTGNFRLVYRRHELRQPAQASINNQWLTRPFLYNYETYEYYEKAADSSNINFVNDIAISQQRPTEIIIKVIYTASTTPQTITTGSGAGVQLAWPNSGITCVQCTNLKIYIAGRQQYYLRTTTAGTSQFRREGIKDATNVLNQLVNMETYSNSDSDIEVVTSSQMSSTEEFFLKISINPGDMQKNGYLSTDQGAVVVRIDADFHMANVARSPIPANSKIVYYKKLPEQITLDANKNITTITWPAVKSNSGYLIEQTFNTN